jgi:hypothetical protein
LNLFTAALAAGLSATVRLLAQALLPLEPVLLRRPASVVSRVSWQLVSWRVASSRRVVCQA